MTQPKLEFNDSGFATPFQQQLATCSVRVSVYDGAKNTKNPSAKKDVKFAQFQLSKYNKSTDKFDNVSLSMNDLTLIKVNIDEYIAALEAATNLL